MSGERLRVWTRRTALWLPALLFFLASLVALVVYAAVFADEAAVSREQVQEAEERLAELSEARNSMETYVGRVEQTREDLRSLYQEILSTEGERLTTVIREVRQLAREANLEPQQASYPEETLEEFGLEKRSFVFTVEGTYFDLRKLINSLELTDSFLTLEGVQLSGSSRAGNDSRLRINLQLSTLFATPETLDESLPPPVTAQGSLEAAGTAESAAVAEGGA